MGSFRANGHWTLYSVQKTLPIIGRIGAVFGAHNYLVLVDPDGRTDSEMHGVYSGHFVANGPVAGNYLQVKMFSEDGYMAPQSVLSAKPVFFGTEEDMRRIFRTGYEQVAKSLDATRMLYDGAEIVGHAVNSNSVWYTALRAMGVEDPSQFDGWGSTPGNSVDLREEPSNNEWFGKSEDQWSPNPAFIFPGNADLPPTNEVLEPVSASSEPDTAEIEVAIEAEQEQLRQQLQDIVLLLDSIDADDLPADRDVIDGFLNDLTGQLDRLVTLSGAELLDRLGTLVDRLSEWRDYLQDQLEADNIPGDGMLSLDDQDRPPDEEQPPASYQEEEPEPEPEYAWSDSDPQPNLEESD